MTCNLRSNESGVSPELFPPGVGGDTSPIRPWAPFPVGPSPSIGVGPFPPVVFGWGDIPVCPPLPPQVLALDGEIRTIAEGLAAARSMLVMGRGYQYGTCLEGALVCKGDGGGRSWVFHSFIYFLISFCPARVWWRQGGEDECAGGGRACVGRWDRHSATETWKRGPRHRPRACVRPPPARPTLMPQLPPIRSCLSTPPSPLPHRRSRSSRTSTVRGSTPGSSSMGPSPSSARTSPSSSSAPPPSLCPPMPIATGPGRPAPWVVAELGGGGYLFGADMIQRRTPEERGLRDYYYYYYYVKLNVQRFHPQKLFW